MGKQSQKPRQSSQGNKLTSHRKNGELNGSITRQLENDNKFERAPLPCKGVGVYRHYSFLAVLLGIVLGSVLAIARNYCTGGVKRLFQWISIAYIEIFRNTPLMLWIFIGLVYLPSADVSADIAGAMGFSRTEIAILIKAVIALVLFTSSVIAEIVRGGLKSIPKGQFEAAYSQGFGFVKTLLYIVLPQTFRSIIPTLLSQVITTIKDTSYIANIAVI